MTAPPTPSPTPSPEDGWLRSATAPSASPRVPADRHPPGERGLLDESARRLSHEELTVAQLLVAEGHLVRSLAPSGGPTADFDVCGRETEVKTLNPGATNRTLTNAIRRAQEQGVDVIVDARQSGLLRLSAEQGVAEFAVRRYQGRVEGVRVLGSGFDHSYQRHHLDRLGRRAGGPSFERGIG